MKDKVFFQAAIDPWPCGILTGEFSVALISQNGVLLKCLTIEVGFLIRGAVCWAPKVAAGAYSWALGCTQDYFPVKHAFRIRFISRGSVTLRSTWSSYCRLFCSRIVLRAFAFAGSAPPSLEQTVERRRFLT